MTIQEIQQLKRVEVKRPVDFIFGGKSFEFALNTVVFKYPIFIKVSIKCIDECHPSKYKCLCLCFPYYISSDIFFIKIISHLNDF